MEHSKWTRKVGLSFSQVNPRLCKRKCTAHVMLRCFYVRLLLRQICQWWTCWRGSRIETSGDCLLGKQHPKTVSAVTRGLYKTKNVVSQFRLLRELLEGLCVRWREKEVEKNIHCIELVWGNRSLETVQSRVIRTMKAWTGMNDNDYVVIRYKPEMNYWQ